MNLKSEYLEFLNSINDKYLKTIEMLTYEEVVLDQKLCQKLEREKKELSTIALKFQEFNQISNDLNEFISFESTATEDKEAIKLEIAKLTTKQESLAKELISLIQLNNAKYENIIVIIQNNDNNSTQFQNDIRNGYYAFCENHNLKVLERNYKNTIELKISGLNAKEYFVNEIGIHKQINNTTESGTCTVFVLDNIEKEELSFEDKDILIQTSRASGAGGQHINTTDSAIKITHIKSGISTICQNERSQFQNREKALEQLKEKVTSYYQKKYDNFINTNRTKQYKSLNIKDETKLYDYYTKIIKTKNKSLSFTNFLSGEEL